MNRDEVQSLHAALKEANYRCLDQGAVLERWFAMFPEVDRREARACAMVAGRCPFPSVAGNPPVYRDRPYYDARYWEPRELHYEADLL